MPRLDTMACLSIYLSISGGKKREPEGGDAGPVAVAVAVAVSVSVSVRSDHAPFERGAGELFPDVLCT